LYKAAFIVIFETQCEFQKFLNSNNSKKNDFDEEYTMISYSDMKFKIDIFLKVTNQNNMDIFDIIFEHIKVTKRNPEGYTWWGNNQPFTPEKLNKIISHGHKPKVLITIPHTSGGRDNIHYIADITDAMKIDSGGVPSDKWRPQYYFNNNHNMVKAF
jgi:hypothetical protein